MQIQRLHGSPSLELSNRMPRSKLTDRVSYDTNPPSWPRLYWMVFRALFHPHVLQGLWHAWRSVQMDLIGAQADAKFHRQRCVELLSEAPEA